MTLVNQVETYSAADQFMSLSTLDQAAMDALPVAVYLCGSDGGVLRFNQKAAELWGRTPKAGDPAERYCGSFRLYRTDGVLLPHDQCPMATALQTGESFRNLEVVVEKPDGHRITVLVNIAAVQDGEGVVHGAINCFHDITDRKQEEHQQRQLIQELNHRIQNTLATVRSVAANTVANATSFDDFTSRFEARLHALSQAHRMLSEGKGAKLHEVVSRQLEPFETGQSPRVRWEGPDVDLPPQLALPLGMILHELMTNAAKYGALSAAAGRISIAWELLSTPEGARVLTLRWVEMDGPAVIPPQRTGFGTRMIKTITNGLGGKGNLHFDPSGLQLSASIPL